MAEFERAAHFRQGHIFDGSSVRLDLWRLLRIFLAERAFAEFTEAEFHNDGWDQPLVGLDSEFGDYEVTRILLSAAVSLRVIDDRDVGVLAAAEPCGTLMPDVDREGAGPLSLREACNKILHATRINFDVERLDGGDINQVGISPPYLHPTIYLYGTHRGRAWKATLDVMAFIRGASIVVPG